MTAILSISALCDYSTAVPGEVKGLRGLDRLQLARWEVPAIIHAADSARVQTVDRDRHGRYYSLLMALDGLTGRAVLGNESFDVRGEKVVCTPSATDPRFRQP